jgi:hypothetical protein
VHGKGQEKFMQEEAAAMDLYKNAKLIIASPSESDHAGWLRLWKGYQAFYKTDIPESATAQTWRRMRDPAEPVYGALAFLDGAIVGMVHSLDCTSFLLDGG